MKKSIVTSTGDEMIQVQDGAGLPREEGWFSPTANPFLHGCCDCGLAHRVEFTVVDSDGVEQIFPANLQLALRFSRDDKETATIRGQRVDEARRLNVSVAAARLALTLKAECPPTVIEQTTFDGVKIKELDRDALLSLVAILAAGKPEEAEPSRIIRV